MSELSDGEKCPEDNRRAGRSRFNIPDPTRKRPQFGHRCPGSSFGDSQVLKSGPYDTCHGTVNLVHKFLTIVAAREATHSFATMKVIITYLGYVINSGTCILGQETNFKVRPTPEKDALYILYSAICNTSVREALRAGLVSRWLAKYPFGGPKSSESRKVEIVQSLRAGRSEDFMMRRILVAIDSDPEGRKQLRNYHLLGSVIGETPDDDEDGDILMIGGEDVAGHSNGRLRHRGSRIHEESLEEQALRRRRREAMVISDDGAPLSRDNIIQGQAYHE